MTAAPVQGRALLAGELRRQWRGIAIGTALGLLWTAGKLSIPRLVSSAVDRGIVGGNTGALVWGSLLVGVIGAVSGCCSGARRWNSMGVARRSESELRDRVFAHLQGLHFGFHDRAHTGDLMSRANTDLNSIQQVVSLIPVSTAHLMTVLGATVLLLWTDLLLAAVAVVTLPLLHLAGRRFATRLHPEVLAIQVESAELATVVEELVSGIRVVKGFGAEATLAARFAVEVNDVYDASLRAARVRSRYLPALELLPASSIVAVLALGGHAAIDGRISLGELVAFNVYLIMLASPLRMLGNVVTSYQRAVAAGGRVHEILATAPEIVDPPRPRPLPPGRGAVRFEGVRFGYDGGAVVLDGLDLHIEAGTSVALVGLTGSGKTTVARLLPRFYDVDGGRITLDGVDVRELRLRDLRMAVATVFDDTFLFNDTIGANIALADPSAAAALVELSARQAGAHEFVDPLPERYGTPVGERGLALSGGQRQRLAIARAVLADPRVLILDDATSAVDPSKEHEIAGALREVMRGRTTIVIAHRPATVALADRVVLLDGGRVAAEGSHAELLARSHRYRDVLAVTVPG